MDIKKLAAEQEEYIIACRRHLHRHPELSCQEFETTKFILSELEKMGIPYTTFNGCTGCVAEIKGTQRAGGFRGAKRPPELQSGALYFINEFLEGI